MNVVPTYVFGPFKLFRLFPAVLRYDGDPAGIAAYLLCGASKARMRSGLCAIVFTHRIVAKTRAALASALFDSHCDCRLLANKRVALFLLLETPVIAASLYHGPEVMQQLLRRRLFRTQQISQSISYEVYAFGHLNVVDAWYADYYHGFPRYGVEMVFINCI